MALERISNARKRRKIANKQVKSRVENKDNCLSLNCFAIEYIQLQGIIKFDPPFWYQTLKIQ